MHKVFGWMLIVIGLMLAVGGVGMIPIGLSTNHHDVSLVGVGWAVLGSAVTAGGFWLRKPRRESKSP